MRKPRLAVAACAAAVPMALPAPALARHRSGGVDRSIIRSINAIRRQHHLRPLRFSGVLTGVAAGHSASMARYGYFAHGNAASRVRGRAHAAWVGETLAWFPRHTRGLARRVVSAWMHSPPHRFALLNGHFSRIGVADHTNRGGVYITADLAS